MADVMGTDIADGHPYAQVSAWTSAMRSWFLEAYAVEVREKFPKSAGVRIIHGGYETGCLEVMIFG